MEKTRRRKEHMKFKKRGTIILKMDQITQVLYSHSDMWNIPNIYHVFIVQRGGDIMLHNSVSVPRDLHVRTKCVPRYTFFCTWLSGCVTWTTPVRDWVTPVRDWVAQYCSLSVRVLYTHNHYVLFIKIKILSFNFCFAFYW